MSHGTKIGQRAPSSKIGRNSRKCENYRAKHQQEKNATRKARTQGTRWERDNRQRIDRLELLLPTMIRDGVSPVSVAYRDQEAKLDHAWKMRMKWAGVK